MSDPRRTMLGAEQRQWLFGAIEASEADWHLLASPSILNRTCCEDPGEPLKTALLKLKLMDEDGEGPDEDQWDGYPAERRVLLERLSALENAVVLSGDIHVSLAAEVCDEGGDPVVPEITTPSLTSQNLDEKLGVEPRSEGILAAERAYAERLRHIHWADFASHGYVLVDLDADRLRAEWWHVDGVLERLSGESRAAVFEAARGKSGLAAAD